MKFEPAAFWDKKILRWEKDKYFFKPIFFINFDVNSSVKTRLRLARSILKDVAPGLEVLEIGCGSALLMEDILSFGASKYIGIDVSCVAIAAAKQRALTSENKSKVELIVKNINDIEPINADICFSLGLFDWLSLNEIALLQKKINSKYYFHSFSEKKPLSFRQIFHKIYVYLMYGHKNSQYVPLYYTDDEITQALNTNGALISQFLRHPKLSFGCFVYCLPSSIESLK